VGARPQSVRRCSLNNRQEFVSPWHRLDRRHKKGRLLWLLLLPPRHEARLQPGLSSPASRLSGLCPATFPSCEVARPLALPPILRALLTAHRLTFAAATSQTGLHALAAAIALLLRHPCEEAGQPVLHLGWAIRSRLPPSQLPPP